MDVPSLWFGMLLAVVVLYVVYVQLSIQADWCYVNKNTLLLLCEPTPTNDVDITQKSHVECLIGHRD